MKNQMWLNVVAGAALLAAAGTAKAGFSAAIYTNSTAFKTAAGSLPSFELALEAPTSGSFQNVTPGITVGNVTYSDPDLIYLFNNGGYGATNYYLGGCYNDFSLAITGGYEAISFYAGLGGGANTADISVNGGTPTAIELYGGSAIFVGIVDSVPITTLSFTDANSGYAEFDIVAPDNLSPVPEPSALALSAFGGFAGFLVWRRRK